VRKKLKRRLFVEQLEARDLLNAYFVAPTGNDGNTGSSASPWLTLQKAANSVNPGDVVTVQAGNYTGFNITKSGTASAPITFQANPGAVINHPASWGGLNFGINASGPSYNVIQGFTITAQPSDPLWDDGIRMGGIFPGGAIPNWATGNIIRNNTVQLRVVPVGDQTSNHDQLPIFTSWQTGLIIQNNTASGGWDSGIYVSNSSSNYTIQGNTIFNVGGNGIHNNGDASQGGPGVNTNALIQNNIIHDVGFGIGGQAISCDGLQNSRIQNNLIYNTWSKGISLYVVNASAGSTNNLVVNNTVLTGDSGSTGVAMRIDGGSTGNQIYNNIFYNTVAGGWPYEVDGGAETIDYNVVMDPAEAGANLQAWHSWGYDLHGILATPSALFVNPTGGNFQLKAGSPAIDVGTATGAPSADLLGNPRPSGNGYDLGAYEYQAGPVAPGIAAVTPIDGLTSGGQSVTIIGSNFSGATGVFFGGVAASSFTINSDTTITAMSPAHSAGTVNVAVAISTSSSATSTADQFQYVAINGTAPPTVATAASATLASNQASAALSVLGASQYGANMLTYTWSTTGTPPAPVTFSSNGINSASNVTATFTRAGSYSFQVTITDPAGNSATSSVGVTVNQVAATLTVSPPSGTVVPNGTLQFTYTAANQFGNAYTGTVSWIVSGGGTIDTTGKFTAGSVAGGPFTVTASAGGLSATASVTISSNVNLAPNGTAYRWFGLSSATAISNQTAAPGLNDNNLTTDVGLAGGDDVANAYEAAGVIWSTAQSVNKVTFTNGSFNSSSYDGVFDNNLSLQTTTDGTTWISVSGWSLSPAYQYNLPAAAGLTYTFTGAALSVRGFRVVGQVHSVTSGNDSWFANATEVQAFATGASSPAPTVTSLSPSSGGLAGGISVIITGTNFTGATGVSFGGVAASSFTVNSATQISGVAPATSAAGSVDVTVTTGNGTSAISAADHFTYVSPPSISAQPAGVTVTVGQSASFTVSAAGTGTLSYQWQKLVNGTWTNISGATLATFTITAAAATDAGSYDVIVANVGGSIASNAATLTVNPAAPPAPTGLNATPGNNQVSLSWSASTGATGYQIYRGTTTNGETLFASPTGTLTTYVDSTAANGTTYYYEVTAVNSGGQSPRSAEVSATPQAPLPGSPSGLTATGGILQIALTWSAGTNNASYKVYRSTVSGFTISSSTLIASPSGASYTDSTVTAGTTYFYLVTGLNTSGQESPPSSQASATAQAAAPGSPSGLTAAGGVLKVVLSWTAGSNDASYKVYRSTVSGFAISSSTLLGSASSASYTDSTGTVGTTYFYLVTGLNTTGQQSAASNQASAAAQAAVPGSPTGLTATGGVQQIVLTWTAGSNDASYKVYRSTVSGFTISASTLIAGPTGTSYTDANVTAGTSYFYLVTGLNTTGQESLPSAEASATAQASALPTAPTGLGATGGVLKIVLSWTAGSNDATYNVYRSTVSGFAASSSTLLGNTSATTYTDNSPSAGSMYYYLVTGLNTSGQESAASNQASASAQAGAPGSPSGLTAAGGALNVVLSWTAGSNDASYKVYRSTVSGFAISSSTLLGSASSASYTDSTGTVGTTYFYLVTGLNTTGQQSAASNQASAAVQAAVPGSPTGLTATGGVQQIVLTWTAGSNDASYKVYRSTVLGFSASSSTLVGSVSSVSYTDTTAVAGTSYFYMVTGLNTTGQESAASNQASATAQAPAPGSPTGLTATGGVQQIVLTWTAGGNDASYKVYRSTVSGFAPASSTLLGSTAGASYTDASATSGTTYYYLVTGLNTTGQESSPSNQASASAKLAAGLVAAYSFDEGSGTVVHDLSGNGNNGTIQNALWSTSGKYGSALSFNGSNSWVTIPNSSSIALTNRMTLEAWVDPSTVSGWRMVIDKERIAASGLSYTLLATNNSLSQSPASFVNTGGQDQSASGGARLAKSTWAFVASTYDGSTLRMYVNGQLVGSSVVNGNIVETSDPLHIGGSQVWGEWFKGLIDNIRIYNVALSQSQIQTDMVTPLAPPAAPLAAATSLAPALSAPASTPTQGLASLSSTGGAMQQPGSTVTSASGQGSAGTGSTGQASGSTASQASESFFANIFRQTGGRRASKHSGPGTWTPGGVDFWLD
jgi:fibronectin type 3 domain-containing protein